MMIRKIAAFVIALMCVFAEPAFCEGSVWDCPECGKTGNTGKYCGGCAHEAPWFNTGKPSLTSDELMEVLQGYSIEELRQIQTNISRLISEKKEIAIPKSDEKPIVAEEGTTLRELFPDLALAKNVRNSMQKGSVDSVVTQDELDSLTSLTINQKEGSIESFQGINALRNLKKLTITDSLTRFIYPDTRGPVENGVVYSGTECPPEIGLLTQLEELTFENFFFTKLPDWLVNMPNLQKIKFAQGNLDMIPDWIGDLQSLTSLTFEEVYISVIPESIGSLSNLQTLVLTRTNILTLPESIGALDNLVSLQLDNSHLAELPESVCKLQSLKKLNLERTAITKLPENIGNLQSLSSLDLSESQITSLPESIVSITSLTNLDLSNTPIDISGIPSALFSMPGLKINTQGTKIE